MNTTPIKVILKTDSNGDIVLFLPESPVNLGNIGCYSPNDGHCEASLDYYLECKPYKGTQSQVNTHLNNYANYGEYIPTIRAYKFTDTDKKLAWER